jgi:hypothetical protein
MVLSRKDAASHANEARKSYNKSYNSGHDSIADIHTDLLEANFHATMAVYEELVRMREEADPCAGS